MLLSYIRKFESVFTKDNFDILPKYCCQEHIIKLILGAKLKSSKVYLLFPTKQTKLDDFFTKNLHTDRICSSKSLMAMLVFFIKKKNSLLQLVQDYKILNSIIIKTKYLLPLISKLVSQLCSTKYFILTTDSLNFW